MIRSLILMKYTRKQSEVILRYKIEPLLLFRVIDTKTKSVCYTHEKLEDAEIHQRALQTGKWDEYEKMESRQDVA